MLLMGSDADMLHYFRMTRTAAQQLSFADLEALPTKPAATGGPDQAGALGGADRAALNALEAALADARARADDRPPLLVLASCLGQLGVAPARPTLDGSRIAPAGARGLAAPARDLAEERERARRLPSRDRRPARLV